MKKVAQWAEQLPELVKIEFLKVNNKMIYENFKYLYNAIKLTNCPRSKFWCGVYENALIDPTSADYLDETIPYTKEEVEAMILEFADPNDEVCKAMLENLFDNQIKDVEQNLEDNFKPLHDNDKVWNDLMETGVAVQQIEAPKDIVKQNIEASMASALDYFNDYFKLKKENEALKREVEAGKMEIKKLTSIVLCNDELIAVLERELKATQEAVAPKKEQSIFFDLLEHIGLRK